MRIGIVGGKYDLIHEGHCDSIVKAGALCDYLIIVTHRDDIVAKCSKKGFCAVPLKYRCQLLHGYLLDRNIAGTVVVGIDEDGTMVKTLEKIKKSCQPLDKITFYRGGDRTISNMNNDEIKICNKLGIEIEYGVGDLLNSSSKIMARMSK